jgi:hypothetical protein
MSPITIPFNTLFNPYKTSQSVKLEILYPLCFYVVGKWLRKNEKGNGDTGIRTTNPHVTHDCIENIKNVVPFM